MKSEKMSEIEQLVDTGYVTSYTLDDSDIGDDYISPRVKSVADDYLLINTLVGVFRGVDYLFSKVGSAYSSLTKGSDLKVTSPVDISSVSDYV